MPKPVSNDITQFGAAIDAKLGVLMDKVDAVSARVDAQANALNAVNKRVDTVAQSVTDILNDPNFGHPLPPVVVPDPPRLADWKAAVLAAADMHFAKVTAPGVDGVTGLGYCYYDGALIWRNLAAFFNKPDYLQARDATVKFYRDWYCNVQPTPGAVSGIDVFPHGLYWHFKDTGDDVSKAAVIAISQHAAFASIGEIVNYLPPLNSSREAAYALMAKLYARDLGAGVWGIEELKAICLGHLLKWRSILSGSNATPSSNATDGSLEDVRAFMVGLTSQALITYATFSSDGAPDIRQALTETLNLLWDKMYVPDAKAMEYDDRMIPTVGDTSPAPDLNMLIAPAYAWIGQRERADLLFEGSLAAWLYGDKQFNQTCRWMADYFTWRTK